MRQNTRLNSSVSKSLDKKSSDKNSCAVRAKNLLFNNNMTNSNRFTKKENVKDMNSKRDGVLLAKDKEQELKSEVKQEKENSDYDDS